MRNEVYDPCQDESLTLDQITKYIKDQDSEIKYLFRRCREAPQDSDAQK